MKSQFARAICAVGPFGLDDPFPESLQPVHKIESVVMKENMATEVKRVRIIAALAKQWMCRVLNSPSKKLPSKIQTV
jgi:hypothetical protein